MSLLVTNVELNQDGTTLVELLVVIIVSSLLIGVTTSFGLGYWGTSATLQSDQDTLVSRLNSGDYLRNSLNAASGLIVQNDLPDVNAGQSDPSKGTAYWLPIHAVPKTVNVGSSGSSTPVIYFNRPSVTTTNGFSLNGTQPYEDNIVIYLNGTTKQLLARTIANGNTSNNKAKTSCPFEIASSSCPADRVLSEDVSSVTTKYFSRSGNSIDYTSITDPTTGMFIGPDFPSVEVVELKVNLSRKATLSRGANSISQTVVRVALRN